MEKTTHFVGESLAFLDAVEQAGRAADLNRPVLVIGERGTGKELIAERIHRLSQRWDGPLIIMNCAALPETLIEAELFGHEAGAFTGATRARAGRFEEADGGTLFLDELGTLSMAAQERLLRAVEYGEVTRIGSSRPLNVDVRIVGATNEHLPDAVEAGRFRADLLDRLSFEVITLPPLRGREGDVDVLVEHFGRKMASECGWSSWPGFSMRMMTALNAYRWPGNVRELRNVVERAVYRWPDPDRPIDEIQLDPFASPWKPQPMPGKPAAATAAPVAGPSEEGAVEDGRLLIALDDVADFRGAVDAHEAAILRHALQRHRFNQRATAKAIGLSYDQLRHCLKKHALL
ncbi:psp operon transcriptional activator [Sphingobium sp. B2D3A]|uniref:phage shock protein operon transcriptional activator n=1 Tax=unclassified Sphingobium TaxID=2611147 RepID=UPI0022246374|nr:MULTISPECIES: phage shock protein operon transcriptional activator [unclassified Sphingobium]MCW2336162.1 psp operon transcriptional activator [Sphingobium sp. B2D3A]MCW2385917.1 psp operon transcriptional activator [Sphingobium sp. B2D3D]MCW2413606.1 psp operon transcriptional activator [Sphingobium sp. B8D3D]MCW2414093.1 psp operon transcriptional activator [Sphingobium sp. B8D3A]